MARPLFFSFYVVTPMITPNSKRAWNPTSVRFTPSELAEVTSACQALRISRSMLLRRASLTMARELKEASRSSNN